MHFTNKNPECLQLYVAVFWKRAGFEIFWSNTTFFSNCCYWSKVCFIKHSLF